MNRSAPKPDLEAQLAHFRRSLIGEEGASAHTIAAYSRDLALLQDLAGDEDWAGLTPVVIRGFVRKLAARGLSGRSIARAAKGEGCKHRPSEDKTPIRSVIKTPRFPAGRCGSVPRAFCIYCSAGARRFLARCSVLPQTGPKTQKSPAAFKNAAELCDFMAKISRSAFQLPLLRGQGWFRGPSCRQGRCRRRGCAACRKGQCPAGRAASRSSCPALRPWPCRR